MELTDLSSWASYGNSIDRTASQWGVLSFVRDEKKTASRDLNEFPVKYQRHLALFYDNFGRALSTRFVGKRFTLTD